MFRRLWDVLNKYKAELVEGSSWWMKEMITVFTETRHGDKPRPSRSFANAFGVSGKPVSPLSDAEGCPVGRHHALHQQSRSSVVLETMMIELPMNDE